LEDAEIINYGEIQFENEREKNILIASLSILSCKGVVSMKKILPKRVGETTRIHPKTDTPERDS